eukprot:6200628-Pleurochrysis_carterae.AAC.2
MHIDGDDDGVGTIVYLNHKDSKLAATAGMPHADLVVASGQTGGRLIRIQTFSPQHVVGIQMDFRNCVHGNVEIDCPRTDGISQLRMIHYNRADLAELVRHYANNPSLSMLEGDRKEYLLQERRALGVE